VLEQLVSPVFLFFVQVYWRPLPDESDESLDESLEELFDPPTSEALLPLEDDEEDDDDDDEDDVESFFVWPGELPLLPFPEVPPLVLPLVPPLVEPEGFEPPTSEAVLGEPLVPPLVEPLVPPLVEPLVPPLVEPPVSELEVSVPDPPQ
jgi:hypothetical protein